MGSQPVRIYVYSNGNTFCGRYWRTLVFIGNESGLLWRAWIDGIGRDWDWSTHWGMKNKTEVDDEYGIRLNEGMNREELNRWEI